MTSMKVGRGEFLRWSGIVGGAAGLHVAGLRELGASELEAAQAAQDAWIATTCQMCGGTTGVLAHVVNGRVVKIEPNKYNPAGERGKLQIFIGLVTHREREPLAGRVFASHFGDPSTVAEQIQFLQRQFGCRELMFVGGRGVVKSKGKQALQAAGPHSSSALTVPQIRRLLGEDTLSLGLASENLCEAERDFRELKTGLLEVRPIRVGKERRTRGHVFSCMPALKLSRELDRRPQTNLGTTDSNAHIPMLPDALAALSRQCLLEYPTDGETTLPSLPQPDARRKGIPEALGVSLPKKSNYCRSKSRGAASR